MYLSDSKNKVYTSSSSTIIFYAIFVLGLALRIFHLIYNRSLWMDEVYLSTSLVKMSYKEIISTPLYYQQKAPIGFLLTVKFFVNQFGNKEIYLRIFPLISGIASMLLFITVSQYFLKNQAALLASSIFCLSPALIYHSVEIKQYSTELLGTLLALFLFIKFKEKNDIKSLLLWGISGAIILWFSYASIFVFAGIGIGLSIYNLFKKNWNIFFISLIPFSIWLISFVTNYLLFTHKHAESEWIAYWFRAYDNFMPFPPKSITDLKWFAISIYRMLDYPLGLLWNFSAITKYQALNMLLKMPMLPIILLVVGLYTVIKKKNAETSLILLIPIILMFLASGLELYPLTERFWVFISPIFIIIISFGFEYLSLKFKSKALSIILFALLITGPVFGSIYSIVSPEKFYIHKKSFQREALLYLDKNYAKNDAVYIYWNNLPGFKLYYEMYNFKYNAIEGTDQRNNSKNYKEYYQNLQSDFNKFSNNKRVWVVYNTQFLTDIGDRIDTPKWYYTKDLNPTNHLLNELFKNYKPIKKYATKDVSLYLLELKQRK
ncbi:hypothetical protein [Pedobacter jamesrossensis]|uniref:Glycosyltransferase RgtA/B/C/D-like domain-containing protein n=1 Tax=Pedobacter jamesrossensis TaxID=1908238 RepID=A0ABV8NL66_9SPHI